MSKRWLSATLLVLASFTIAGLCASCSSEDDPQKKQTANERHASDEPQLPPPKPIFENWSDPAFVMCVTGETHGYLEPCGCSETQSGGVSRRADLFSQIKERGWQRATVDLGGSLKRNRRQSQIKFEALLEALREMEYSGMALGREELRLDPYYLLTLDTEDQLPLWGANTSIVQYDGFPKRDSMIEIGDKTVGVVSVIGMSYRGEVVPPQNPNAQAPPDVDILDPVAAIEKQLEHLEAENAETKPDLLVLLSHSKLEESRSLAEKFPQFDLIVSAGGHEDPSGKPEIIGPQKAMLVTVGHKGKHVGVIGYYPDEQPKLKFELIELDNIRFQDTPAMQDVMRRYQERLADENIADDMKRVPHESGANYVGAAVCGECHTKAYAKWKTTKHHLAYESLAKGRKGQEQGWASRVYDPECLSCHVTGWNPQEVFPYESGFINAESTPHLMGQQCENCHGPGSIHTDLERKREAGEIKPQDEELLAQRKEAHLDQGIAEKQLCNKCHDLDNSPKFDFKKYWEQVAHPGRD